MNVVEFKREGWRDIPDSLRRIADNIDAGEYPEALVCGLVMYYGPDSEPTLNLWGLGPQAEDLQVLAALTMGQQTLASILLAGSQ